MRQKKAFKRGVLILGALLLGIVPLLQNYEAKAADSLWVDSDPIYKVEENPASAYPVTYPYTPCTETELITRTQTSSWPTAYGDTMLKRCFAATPYGSLSAEYLKFQNDRLSGRLDIGYGFPVPVPNSDKFFQISNAPWWGSYLSVYNNAETLFQKSSQPANGHEWVYSLKRDRDFLLRRSNNEPMAVGAMAFSKNAKWMVAQAERHVLVKINLDTFEVLPIANDLPGYGGTTDTQLSIDDTGRYISVSGGAYNQFKVYDTSTCNAANPSNNLDPVSGCGVRDLTNFLMQQASGTRNAYYLNFSSDATELSVTIHVGGVEKRISLTAAGHETERLDYLALGDSFSSGEGDTAGSQYYRQGTDTEKEKCHVSTRSYPYLLAQQMGISDSKFKSIACSGAVTGDIIASHFDYNGQQGRLNLFPSSQRGALITDAKKEFIPGRIPQKEFVSKYKPKVITLTIGGNDVHFRDKIKSCVGNDFLDVASPTQLVCERAANEAMRYEDGQALIGLRQNLITTYQELHQASPTSKIYVLGYPKFVEDDTNCTYGANLNSTEVTYANESVDLLNKVTESAAKTAGVGYLNIQDSLNGHKLCSDGTPTAFNKFQFGHDFSPIEQIDWLKTLDQGMYHPNEYGHDKVANAVTSQVNNLLTYNYCENNSVNCPQTTIPPEPSIYFAKPQDYTNNLLQSVLNPLTTFAAKTAEGATEAIQVSATMLQANTSLSFELHSDPTPLGTFTADQDGKVAASFQIPASVPAGYHTLHAYGTTPSGQAIDLYRTIFVLGQSGDIDEDGDPDSTDKCAFIKPINKDHDLDDIDDACDGTVGESPLYRARQGNPVLGEPANFVYIERSLTYAPRIGITDDYDPDNNGWAVVGRSYSQADSGDLNKFWVDDNNIPHVKIDQTEQCIQLKPVSLSKVLQSESRELTHEEITSECSE